MHSVISIPVTGSRRVSAESPAYIKWPLITAAVSLIALLVIVPVAHVFYSAIAPGMVEDWTATAGSETSAESNPVGGKRRHRNILDESCRRRRYSSCNSAQTLAVAPAAVD